MWHTLSEASPNCFQSQNKPINLNGTELRQLKRIKTMAKAQILVVEDESIVAEDIRMCLQKWGYSVPAVVYSGKEAVKKAGENKPDLVLMDIRLQGEMNGIEAAEEIRECFNIPVVYLTAYKDGRMLKQAKITEPYGYVIKPFEDIELQTTVERALCSQSFQGIK
jgi:CheY-like chemotaxis protein